MDSRTRKEILKMFISITKDFIDIEDPPGKKAEAEGDRDEDKAEEVG